MQSTSLNTPSTGPSSAPSLQQAMMTSIRNAIAELFDTSVIPPITPEPRQNTALREYSEVIRETDVMAIPDVHGDIVALKRSLKALGLIDSSDHWAGGNKVAVFLGDYIDRGNTNLEVLDYVLKLKSEAEAAGGRIDLLLGNHESLMFGAIQEKDEYRKIWLRPDNGGGKLFEEVRDKYHLKREKDVWKKLKELFAPKGEYYEYTKSMKLAAQVDDVLYIHAGLDDIWAKIIKDEGVEGVNKRWSQANKDMTNHRFEALDKMATRNGPLWIRYKKTIKNFSGFKVAVIARCLKDRGINAVVVGHDVMDFGSEMNAMFAKEGIKLIAADTGMSSAYNNVTGGVRIDQQGNIEAETNHGANFLHREPVAPSKAA